jgi:hypothetical protein
VGYEDWPSLDELFPTSWQGVNPNRGLSGSIIDVDRDALATRMRSYFDPNRTFEEIRAASPELAANRARYDARAMREGLLRSSAYVPERIVRYLLFPFDERWLYYEPDAKLLNERRREIWDNRDTNEFLVVVPQARRPSEVLPLIVTTLFDLHLHDRGSVAFPAEIEEPRDLLSAHRGRRIANVSDAVLRSLQRVWNLESSVDRARQLGRKLFRSFLAIATRPITLPITAITSSTTLPVFRSHAQAKPLTRSRRSGTSLPACSIRQRRQMVC